MLQDREKHEQLHELLTGYSTNGLPPLPELLALGRPTFDESVFQMEAHWSILVDNASVNIVLFATSLCIHTAVHHSTLFYFLLQSFVTPPVPPPPPPHPRQSPPLQSVSLAMEM